MKKRNVLRAKTRPKHEQNSIMNVNQKATKYVEHAKNCQEHSEIFGKFVLFASSTGEAWILDQREGLALRIADHCEPLQYRIEETKTKFFIEWKERFQIRDGAFIVLCDEKQSVFFDYPVAKLKELFAKIQKNSGLF